MIDRTGRDRTWVATPALFQLGSLRLLRLQKHTPENSNREGTGSVRILLYTPIVITAIAVLVACAPSNHVLVGPVRPAITPDQVKIYSHPPATPFDEIAILDANSTSAFGTGGQKSIDKVIERLRIEAAKLGANGVVVEGFWDAPPGSVGTGVGSDSYGNHSAVGVGLGGSLGIYKKTGHGDAIYVHPTPIP
jgi:hypothetical protein